MRIAIFFLLLLSGLHSAEAALYTATGKIQKIVALDKVHGADASHILVAGFATAGTCPTNDGLIALVVRDDETGRRQVAVALSAKLSQQPVVVRVDDLFKAPGANAICAILS